MFAKKLAGAFRVNSLDPAPDTSLFRKGAKEKGHITGRAKNYFEPNPCSALDQIPGSSHSAVFDRIIYLSPVVSISLKLSNGAMSIFNLSLEALEKEDL